MTDHDAGAETARKGCNPIRNAEMPILSPHCGISPSRLLLDPHGGPKGGDGHREELAATRFPPLLHVDDDVAHASSRAEPEGRGERPSVYRTNVQ
jgi:hypothetical protein